MLAAKMADRITCDICNKDVCNKYFLRAHKLKMHGVDISSESSSTSSQLTPIRPAPSTASQEANENTPVVNRNGTVVAERADDITPESLIRMGIDPEAFCSICKKEFCSKYFLKTHKLNMHGIRSTPTTSSATPAAPIKHEESPAISTFAPLKVSGAGSAAMPPLGGPPHSSVGENFTWRWKEPANQTRVFCDICNKELCNKYFLRTHKINKHGITDENLLRMPPALQPMSTGSSGAGSAMGAPPGGSDKSPLNLSMAGGANGSGPSPMDILSMKFDLEKPNAQGPTNGTGSGAPPLPNSRKAPAVGVADLEKAMFEAEAAMRSALHQGAGVKGSHLPCEICGLMFVSVKELEMHLAEEHQEESHPLTGFPADMSHPPFSGSPQRSFTKGLEKMYSCSHCDYKTRWLSNIYSHEQRKHSGGGGAAPQAGSMLHTCKVCMRSFSYEHSLMRHMAEYHDRGRGKDLPGKALSTSSHSRKIKCHYCSERFPSKALCQSHIHQQHGIRTANMGKGPGSSRDHSGATPASTSSKLYHCDKCDFTCRLGRNLKMHRVIKHKAKDARGVGVAHSHQSQAFLRRSPDLPASRLDVLDLPPRASSCPVNVQESAEFEFGTKGSLEGRDDQGRPTGSELESPRSVRLEDGVIMQPFEIQRLDGQAEFSHGSMTTIYLPVREEITSGEVSIQLLLKPLCQ